MSPLMAGEVLCPKCGTVSPTETRVCPKCGTTLSLASETTSKSKAFSPLKQPQSGSRPAARKPLATDAGMAATPDASTLMEPDEKPAAPKRSAPRPAAGPVPQAGAAVPRRSNAGGSKTNSDGSTSSGARDSLIGRKLQEYVIESKLGVGGMGVVYKATHQMIGKGVAIKVLRPDISPDPRDMDRLLDEARIISSIKNRGIINIFGAGTLEDGRNYLIMELLEGEALEQRMQRETKIPAGDAVIILEQVLSALTAAHEAGVVHRDLKPANVFLVKEANLFYVKLLDFGLARRSQQNVTRIAGTPDYISPEHARGRPAGPPADLYAFGVLCFHMLTGQLPFIGTTPMEVMEKHVHSPPPIPHELNKEIPKALSELILKLLAKEPGERPDAVQVKADLRAATKQMRNATTQMSLMAIEPVSDDPAAKGDEKKRARELAVAAQVADLKRKVTRRWPIVLGAVVGVWFIGVLAYVLWPTPTEPVQPIAIGKKPPKNPLLDPTTNPDIEPVAVKDPTPKDPVDPVVVPKDPVNPVNPNTDPIVDPALDPTGEVDAGGPEVIAETDDTVLDDVTIGERKRTKRIPNNLGEMRSGMKGEKRLQMMFGALVEEAEKKCEAVRTVKQLSDCEDEVNRIYYDYNKAL
ncbi:MAG: protein kinase [Archangium sp.]|nr:protein kinase [Archangium sp.]